jgi:hypothetical protein
MLSREFGIYRDSARCVGGAGSFSVRFAATQPRTLRMEKARQTASIGCHAPVSRGIRRFCTRLLLHAYKERLVSICAECANQFIFRLSEISQLMSRVCFVVTYYINKRDKRFKECECDSILMTAVWKCNYWRKQRWLHAHVVAKLSELRRCIIVSRFFPRDTL